MVASRSLLVLASACLVQCRRLRSASAPAKPRLQSVLLADVHEEDWNGASEAQRFRIAVDWGKRQAGMELLTEGEHPRYATLLDLQRQRRVESHGFFDELVCFDFDFKSDKDDASFEGMVENEILGVPLHLYSEADATFGGRMAMGGEACDVWSVRRKRQQRVPGQGDDASDLGSSDFIPEFAASLSEVVGGSQGLLALELNARFCVTEQGWLRWANMSNTAMLLPKHGAARLLQQMDRSLGFTAVRLNSSSPLAPERLSPGGQCVDLTSQSAEKTNRSLNDAEALHRINEEAGPHWHAVAYERWQRFGLHDLRSILGAKMKRRTLPLQRQRSCGHGFCSSSAPLASFDARERWPQCHSIGRIPNQGACGSCWAVSSASTLADRFCVAASASNSSRFSELQLSPQQLLDCGGFGNGCGGGEVDDAWRFFNSQGLPAEACVPYLHCRDPSNETCGSDGQDVMRSELCSHSCMDGGAPAIFRTSRVFAVAVPGDVAAMQRELISGGPINAAFFVFSDFPSYKNGTYFRTRAAMGPAGGHAVRIIGWGTDSQQMDYWLIANSWGTSWGMDGLFRIRRGRNECGIETMPAAGVPLLEA